MNLRPLQELLRMNMNQLTKWMTGACLSAAVLAMGCDRVESVGAPISVSDGASEGHHEGQLANTESGAGAGGAPSFGAPSGMGFSTGDAAHSGGQGGGLMGFHGTGKEGTSGAMTDMHVAMAQEPETAHEAPAATTKP
jgi:hypothetical protein